MVQTRTISIMNTQPNTPLGPFTATWQATSQLVSNDHWTLQTNALSFGEWIQDVTFIEDATDPEPNGISVSVQACAVTIAEEQNVITGAVIWVIEPIKGAGEFDDNANSISAAQVERGEVAFQFVYDGGLGAPYPQAGDVAALTTNLIDVSTGNVIWTVTNYPTNLSYIVAIEMVGFDSGFGVSFSSGSAQCTFAGDNLMAFVGGAPEYGTYAGPPVGQAQWQNETGETGNMCQYISAWTPTLITTQYTLETPPPDAPQPPPSPIAFADSVEFSGGSWTTSGNYSGISVNVTNYWSAAQSLVIFANMKSGTGLYIAEASTSVNTNQTSSVFLIPLQQPPSGSYEVTFSAITTTNEPVSAPTTPVTVTVT